MSKRKRDEEFDGGDWLGQRDEEFDGGDWLGQRGEEFDGGDWLGHRFRGSLIVAFEYATGTYLMENGTRSRHLTAESVEEPTLRGHIMPALGTHVSCWLGEGTLTSLDARCAVVGTTCSTYAVMPHLLRPVNHTVTVRGLRVLYGRSRCLVFTSLTCTGGATAMFEEIVAQMRLAGMRVGQGAQLLEYQAVGGPAVALRTLVSSGRMLLRLHGRVDGEAQATTAFMDVEKGVAMANLVAEDYLGGNPWALPISYTLLSARLGIQHALDIELMFGSYTYYEDCLHLVAPQRSLADAVFDIDVEHLVVGVRAGRIEAQCDGTYVIPHGQGGYGAVRVRGTDPSELMWRLDDMYDALLPLGTHKVDLPACPDILLMERFGEAYDAETRTVASIL